MMNKARFGLTTPGSKAEVVPGAAKPAGSVTKGDGRDFKGNKPTERPPAPGSDTPTIVRWPKTA